MKLKFNIVVDTTTGEVEVINEETGEVKETKVKKSSTKKTKKVKEESSIPQLILEDNKYTLNSAAVELMNVSPDDRIDIKYEKNKGVFTPIIGKDDVFGTANGNRLTKSNTVSYRGKAREKLAEYGNVFEIKPHSEKEGLFILVSNKEQEVLPASEDIVLPEDDDVSIDLTDDDIDLSDLVNESEDFTTDNFKF